MRIITPLNDGWSFSKEGVDAPAESVSLPHTWNAVDGQDGGNDYWRGTGVYERDLAADYEPAEGDRTFLEVNGAAYTADVYVDGELLAHHEGGFSTFRVDVTDHIPGHLAIKVANDDNDHVYPQRADFTFYGGLYREVNLVTVPAAHFELERMGTPGIRVTPTVAEDLKSAEVEVTVWAVDSEGLPVSVSVFGVGEKKAVIEDGAATVSFHLDGVHLWDGVDDPYLYTATAALESGDQVSCRFGCRRYEIDPQKGFILNGRPYPLRGVSRHQDRLGAGNALTPAMHAEDVALIREIGANTIRLAHYQHAQEFYDLCDEAGLCIWAEIPYITMHMPNGKANTLSQMEELITQCYNHPSIVVWGLSNEITAAPVPDEAGRLANHEELNDLAHRLDPTRPTTMAHVFMLEPENEIVGIPDVGSYNLYFGWYLGELEQNDEFFDEYHEKFPDRAIGLSEYGADANPAFHSSHPRKGDYSEEYQCVYHEHMLRMIDERPWLWATHVWNMFDFGADGRDEGGKHGFNQKGLVCADRATKKDAFYAYKAWWSKEPFVHVCGGRYVDRPEHLTEVRVYSNCAHVALTLDGAPVDEKDGSHVFVFQVPLAGTDLHRIEARAVAADGTELVDAIECRQVEKANPDYSLGEGGDVANWAAELDIDPKRYSIYDKLEELQKQPVIAAMLGKMMKKAMEARGDVATSVAANAQLQRMIGRMTLKSLIDQAGDMVAPDQIEQLNKMLQKFKKKA